MYIPVYSCMFWLVEGKLYFLTHGNPAVPSSVIILNTVVGYNYNPCEVEI